LTDAVQEAIDGSATSLTVTDSSSVDFTASGTLNHTITAAVKISSTSGNRVSILSDGLMASPQTLSINYTTKELTISDGNTVSFASMVCGASGFLGNLTADPTAIDGQYWFRTDLSASDGLRIKLNGSVRTITTS
jgi:hypothetical protein